MRRIATWRAVPIVAAAALVLTVIAVGRLNASLPGDTSSGYSGALPRAAEEFTNAAGEVADKDFEEGSQGTANGGAGGEAAEQMTAQEQWAQARTAPGIVAPGAYSDAYDSLAGLAAAGGSWDEITNVRYDADSPDYRDYFSNSSGGSGLVTGRIVALAADNSGDVYAGGADGGVWRSTTGGGHWKPIADSLPSLSSGDLQLDKDGNLWYATGEANTGGTSYVGTGVYRLSHPETSDFSVADRVGRDELESTTINALRFSSDKVWVATLRGVWSHDLTGDMTTPWILSLVPNPAYLPASMETYLQTPQTLGGSDTTANAPYKNIVNDIAIDPKDDNHLIAAVGWRSGDTYNGFYETKNGGASWTKINPKGAINPKDIGNASFAWAADGSQLYVMNQSPVLLQKLTGTVNSYLDGIYVSNSGSIAGPWSKVADQRKLANSGSALKQSVGGKGYGPGIQSWYNQFLIVDPTDSNHVIAGLEEVYETKDGGSTWSTIGPYWNFYFSCWAPDSLYPPNQSPPNRCPQTTHPDQHAAAIGSNGGDPYLIVGNDGGVYKRPLDGTTDRNGNAIDWTSLNDGSIDALQYYGMGVGALADNGTRPGLTSGDGVLVSGGMQDNGGSLLRPGSGIMNSNFGGDGGDVLVDPNNGCNIVQEYVYLTMEVTQTCANPGPGHPDAFLDYGDTTTFYIAPPDINARFIAPFAANSSNINEWVAGGNTLWFQNKGFNITNPAAWNGIHSFASPIEVATAVAFTGDTIIAGWCGTCNNAGFQRGVVVLHRDGSGWSIAHEITAADITTIPNRYVGGVAIDPNDENHLFIGLNGFSRRFTEGPGAGIGHVYESTDGGATWSDAGAGTFPDVPVNSVRVLPTGGTVVGTDLGVLYRAPSDTAWQRLGDNFPTTVAMDVEYSATDNMVYVATHGRGIWRILNPDPAL